MAGINGDADNFNAVQQLALPKPGSITRIKLAAGIIRESGHDLNFVPELLQFPGEA
jgi:hypothetical protein